MACDVKIQIDVPSKDTIDTLVSTIKLGVDENEEVDLDKVIQYITELSKSERKALAEQIASAKVHTLSSSDIKNHRFISNTTLEELLTLYPKTFANVDNLILLNFKNIKIIHCYNMLLSGIQYYGRTISPDGEEIFFIRDKWGANKLIDYLSTKSKINTSLENNTDILEKFKDDLDILLKLFHYSSYKDLLFTFMDHNKKFKPFLKDGKLYIPSKILNNIISILNNDYNPDANKTDLRIIIENSKNKSSTVDSWNFNMDDLYITLATFNKINNNNFIDRNSFINMSEDELSDILLPIFKQDPKLIRAKIKTISPIQEESEETLDEELYKENFLTLSELLDIWKKVRPNVISYSKALKNNSEEVLNSVLLYLKDNGFTKNSEHFSDFNGSITKDLKLKISYKLKIIKKPKKSTRQLTIYFPYATVGELYNFSYDSDYMFLPVLLKDVPELDSDGIYHGVYIYEYYDEESGTTHYAISRNIISPNSYMNTYSSLETAFRVIDNWNANQKINEWGLYTIKLSVDRPRSTSLQGGSLNVGQIVTSLDLKLPKIDLNKLPSVLKDLFNGTVPNFLQLFIEAFQDDEAMLEYIKLINTPEKAAAFLLYYYEYMLYENSININTIDNNNIRFFIKYDKDIITDIIDKINMTGTNSYIIENVIELSAVRFGSNKLYTIRYLENNGEKILISGKFKDNVSAKTPLIADVDTAIDYFNEKYNLNIHSLTKSELIDFCEKNNLDIGDKLNYGGIKAFIYNGEIYINNSNSNLEDLYNEMAHIFLGAIKSKYPDIYPDIIKKILSLEKEARVFSLTDTVNRLFKDLNELDKREEVVAEIISRHMFLNKKLVYGFNKEESEKYIENNINNIFKLILNDYPKLLEPTTSSLDFKDDISDLVTNVEIQSEVIKNMKMNNLVKKGIEEHKIIEDCK